MTDFLTFLYSECSAIKALVEEVCESEPYSEEENLNIKIKIDNLVSHYPGLKDYFEAEICDLELKRGDWIVSDSVTVTMSHHQDDNHEIDDSHQRKRRKIEEVSHVSTFPFRYQSLRLSIIDYLMTFDIKISLLIDVVESYRLEAEIEELVEIVRAFDILGAEKRLEEYETMLYLQLDGLEKKKNRAAEWRKRCGDKLPESFYDHIKGFGRYYTLAGILGYVGSEMVIVYFLQKNQVQLSKEEVFVQLCREGHLSVAQWLHSLGGVNIHSLDDEVFQYACENSHLVVAQWLHSLGGVNIHSQDDAAFRYACENGHLSVAQWLHSLDGVNIHSQDDEAFRTARNKRMGE
jgi:hypothetical protein